MAQHTCLHTFHVPAWLAHLPCPMPPSGGPGMHLCAYHLPVLPGPPVHIHAVCQGATWWHEQICSCAYHGSSPLCVYTCCFPAPTTAAWVHRSGCGMHPRAGMLWHRLTMFQHHHLVAKAHCLQCPAHALYHVVVWSLLFAHLLCPSILVAQACLFTQGLCCVAVCGRT